AAGGDDVFKMAGPAAAALVGGQAVQHGAIGDALEVEVERGLHAQAILVDLFRSKAAVELLADLVLKPGGGGADRLGDMQAKRGGAGSVRLGASDEPVVFHLSEDQVAAAERPVRVEQGRKGNWAFGKPGKQGGFGERQVAGALGEVILRGGF